MKLNKIQMIILFVGIEDVSGLWKITCEQEFGSMNLQQRVDLARRELKKFLSQGFVKLYWSEEPYGDVTEIDRREWDRVLSLPEYWQVPKSDGNAVRYETTPKGEAAYREAEAELLER